MSEFTTWLDQHNVSLLTVGATVAILVVAFIIIATVSRLLQRWLTQLGARTHWSYDTIVFVTRSIGAVLWLVTVVLILDFWGVSVGGLWTLPSNLKLFRASLVPTKP